MPEILIVDEALSVGDTAFQEKSLARIRSFQTSGSTILLVTHSMETIRKMCSRAAWLDQGKLRLIGPAEEVVSQYLSA
jgi:ABC-type polysaccharide/polyol phosphate transport system ATPase subunit